MSRSSARRRIPAIIAAVALGAGLTAVAATAEGMTRSAGPGSPPSPGSSTVTATTKASATATHAGTRTVTPTGTGTGAPPAAPLPEGFTWWADPLGYRVAVPAGWRRHVVLPTGGLAFVAERDRAAMGVTPLAAPPADVVATLAAAERASSLAAYERVRIEALPEPASAIWEYTFQEPDGTGMRAVQRIIGTATRSYVLEWRTTSDDWPLELNRFTVVLASFTPGP